MDIDALERKVGLLNLAIFGHRDGPNAALAESGQNLSADELADRLEHSAIALGDMATRVVALEREIADLKEEFAASTVSRAVPYKGPPSGASGFAPTGSGGK